MSSKNRILEKLRGNVAGKAFKTSPIGNRRLAIGYHHGDTFMWPSGDKYEK